MNIDNVNKYNVILDTDTNNEVDDQFALAYLLKSKDIFNIDAITIAPFRTEKWQETVSDSIDESYNEACKIFDLLGLKDKSIIYKGSRDYLKNGYNETNPAINKIIEIASKNKKTYILAIGCLTNIALALKTNPEIKDKIEIGYTGTIASKLDLKLVPSITSSNINTIEENSKITIKDIINKWSYVETDNKSGWVLTSKIKVSEQKNEEVKTEENKEQTVEETKKEENTEKTTSKEETKTEEKKKTEVTKYVSAETLNMRETANNNAKLINQLKVNTKVTVLETEGTWSKIKVNGKTGYVASKYLSDKKVDVTSRSEEISRGKQNTQTENTSSKNESNTQGTSSSASGNNIVAYAKKYMGYKYVSGGSSPSTGFDCSGFTSYVYKQCGISISRSSSAQASNGTAVSKSNLQPGDLVIFNNRANTSIGHVGIYIGGNTFIHAGNSGTGVITTSLSDSYYSARYVTGRRIIN